MAQLPDRPGPQLIVKMINDANATAFNVDDFSFGVPEPSERQNHNTQIDLTFTNGPYFGTVKRFYYNRLDFALLIESFNTTFIDDGSFTNTASVLSQINERMALHLTLLDVVNQIFVVGTYPANLTLNAEASSLVLLPGTTAQIVVVES